MTVHRPLIANDAVTVRVEAFSDVHNPPNGDSRPGAGRESEAMRAKGAGVRKIANNLGIGVGTVLRLSVDGGKPDGLHCELVA